MRREYQGESSYNMLTLFGHRRDPISHRQGQVQVARLLELLAAAGRQIGLQALKEIHDRSAPSHFLSIWRWTAANGLWMMIDNRQLRARTEDREELQINRQLALHQRPHFRGTSNHGCCHKVGLTTWFLQPHLELLHNPVESRLCENISQICYTSEDNNYFL